MQDGRDIAFYGYGNHLLDYDQIYRSNIPDDYMPDGLVLIGSSANGDYICFDYRKDKNTDNPPIVVMYHDAFNAALSGNANGASADVLRDATVNVLQGLAAQEVKALVEGSVLSEEARAALHAIVGCAGAAAQSSSCSSAALGAAGNVVLNNLIYGTDVDASKLSAQERENRINLLNSIITGVTLAVGGDSAMASAAAKIEAENNQMAIGRVPLPVFGRPGQTPQTQGDADSDYASCLLTNNCNGTGRNASGFDPVAAALALYASLLPSSGTAAQGANGANSGTAANGQPMLQVPINGMEGQNVGIGTSYVDNQPLYRVVLPDGSTIYQSRTAGSIDWYGTTADGRMMSNTEIYEAARQANNLTAGSGSEQSRQILRSIADSAYTQSQMAPSGSGIAISPGSKEPLPPLIVPGYNGEDQNIASQAPGYSGQGTGVATGTPGHNTGQTIPPVISTGNENPVPPQTVEDIIVHNEAAKPPVFQNLYPEDKPNPANVIPNERLHSITQTGLAYVVLEDGTVVVGRNNENQGHIDLSRGKPVLAAGEVSIINGEIKYIENYSGHYRPAGAAAQRAAEDAFSRLGFDVNGKYVERKFD